MFTNRRDPSTPEARFWLEQFNKQLSAWIDSFFEDDMLLESAEDSLEELFECCPDYAPEIVQIAMGIASIARINESPPYTILPLVKTGLEAATAVPTTPEEKALQVAMLSLVEAEARLAGGERFPGLDALRRAEREARRAEVSEQMADYLRARLDTLRGALEELGLEFERAGKAYAAAAQAAGCILEDEAGYPVYKAAWLQAVLGGATPGASPNAEDREEEASPNLELMAFEELSDLYVRAVLGRARVDARPEEALHLARQAVNRYGLPAHPDPVEVAQVVARLGAAMSREEAEEFVEEILDFAPHGWQDQTQPEWNALLLSALARAYPQAEHAKANKELRKPWRRLTSS